MATIRMGVLPVATLASARVSSTRAESAPALSKSKVFVPSPPSVILPSLPAIHNTPPPDALSPCASGCITAATANSACLIMTNVGCLCTDLAFLAEFTSHLQAECHGSEMEAALHFVGFECSRSISASASTTEIPPSFETPHSPDASLAVAASQATTHTNIPALTSIDTFHSPTPLVSILASSTTAPVDISHQSSAIIFRPTSSHSILEASTETVPFLPQNSAADISPISAADISPSFSSSTTPIAGASNGVSLNLGRTGMAMALRALVLGGLGLL
ncbi:hypothetical protein DFH09DRAFT_1312799 [Mycena vulgaris]|nr:hypothetical protein DFH09DRAFT_1312799 [Mycena vulgaris]